MWSPKGIYVKNFRSIVDEALPFVKGQTYLLQGLNKTDQGTLSNGSGKSSFREALAYVLGLPVYAASVTDLINDEAGDMSVTFWAENTQNKQELEITRAVDRKGTTLNILLNGEDQKSRYSTIPEGDKLIIEIIGLPKEDLLNHFIISKEKFTSFFTSSDTSKKELINRFSGANKIDGVDSLVDTDIRKLESEKRALEDLITKAEGRLDVLNEDLTKEIDFDQEKEKSDIIKKLNAQILDNELDIESLTDTIRVKKGLAEESFKTVERLTGELILINTKISNTEKEIKELREQKNSIDEELSEYRTFRSEVRTSLGGVVKCPSCSHEFNPGSDVDIIEARKLLPTIEKTIGMLESSFNNIKDKMDKLRFNTLDSLNKEFSKLKADISYHSKENSDLTAEVRKSEKSIEIKSQAIIDLQNEIAKTKKSVIQSREAELRKSIKDGEKFIELKKSELVEKITEIENLSRWNIRFKKFRSHLANQSLETIQGFANLYLQKMRSNLGVKIEGFKQNKDGSIREKITPVILRDGVIEGSGSYKKYSGGERCRIDVAITLAMRHLINQASKTGGLDLFWVDEITEGLDSVGVENVAESINELGITSLMVSHVNHEKSYPNIITVIKENGITTISS